MNDDDARVQAIKSLRERHESQIRENAERIREHIGYLIARLDAGRADSVGLYAEDIEASARRITRGVAALEAIAEATAPLTRKLSKGTFKMQAGATGRFRHDKDPKERPG